MGLFDFMKKQKKTNEITTVLNGATAKGRQEALKKLSEEHPDLKAWLGISGGSAITLNVGHKTTIGTVDSKIVRQLEQKYGRENGLSCEITVGQNYRIFTDSNGNLACEVTLTIE